jgi:hypothetical protein|nr:MAG TPA: hypothetical protein [Caudoviricetes sp.]
MKALYELREMLCRELDELAGKGEMSVGDLDLVHKLTDTVKNIDKIMMLEEDGGYSREDGYSRGGGWEARGSYSRYNDGGNSYARSGQHYVRAHYSRDGGSMEEELERLMQKADGQREREMIQRLMDELKKR